MVIMIPAISHLKSFRLLPTNREMNHIFYLLASKPYTKITLRFPSKGDCLVRKGEA